MRRNPFTYPLSAEMWWKNMLSEMSGYQPMTTFFADLSIAECFGESAIRETYDRVVKEWGDNIEYMTEFVLCLNHKIWQLYEVDESTARVFDELWRMGAEFVVTHFEGEDLSYYYRVTD